MVRTKEHIAQALKRLLVTTPLGKVTVTAIASEAGINRQTFYYHFADVYDLVSWIYAQEAERAIGAGRTYETWQQGLRDLLDQLIRDRSFVLETINAVDATYTQRFLHAQTDALLAAVVAEESKDVCISAGDQAFIARFYASALIGCVLDWIHDGMVEEPEALVERIDRVVRGNIPSAISRFAGGKCGSTV